MRVSSLAWPFAAVCAVAAGDKIIDKLSLTYPFVSHDYENDNYDYGGSAVLGKSYARLTADQPDQRGWLYARELIAADNFEVEIEFKIEGAGTSLYGDGMAVWFLAPDEGIEEGAVFGLKDYFKGTAIVIDTYRNHRPGKAFPYVMVMQNDGRQRYDQDNDGKANELAGFSARGLHNPASNSKMRIRYEGNHLTVDLNFKGRWENAFSLPYNLDGASRLAFSASTGQLSERHDIYDVRVTELAFAGAPSRKVDTTTSNFASSFSQNTGSSRKGSWFGLVIKIVLGLGAVVGALKLYAHYKKSKKRNSYQPFEYT